MGRQGVSKGVSLFYEGMPIDYLNNDSRHDWISFQTKINHFWQNLPKSRLSKVQIFSLENQIFKSKIHENLKFGWIFEVQNPHLSLLEIRKGQEGCGSNRPEFNQAYKNDRADMLLTAVVTRSRSQPTPRPRFL